MTEMKDKYRNKIKMKNRYMIMMMVFAVTLAGCGKKEATTIEKKVVPVRVVTIAERAFENNITGEGSVEAKQIAMVTPRISGTITELFVKEGDVVEKGKTSLFSVDSVKLEQAVVLADRALAVSKCAVDEKEALKDQAVAVLNKADIDYKRQKKLFDDKQIGTADTVEKLESNLIQAKASVKHVDTLIQLSKEQVSQAEASLEIAKKDLKDTVVKAPISGVISAKFHDVGDMGTPGVPVFQIESNNDLEASFYISSQLYSAVQLGNMVKIFSNGEEVGEYKLTYKSPSIDKMLRVFEIKADLTKNDKIAPGSLINGVINLRKFNCIGVPLKSIIKKQDGDIVFIDSGSAAKIVSIQRGTEYDGWVSIADESVKIGDSVIVEGQFLLNDGTGITVRK